MENFQTYPVTTTKERCNSLKTKLLPEVLTVLAEENSTMSITSKHLVIPNQSDPDILAICSVLHQNLPYLQDLSISNQNFSLKSLSSIADSLQTSKHITKLSITKSLFTLESSNLFTSKLHHSPVLEYLDLSENSLTDLYAESLSPLFASNIKILILDKNNFQACSFASELSKSGLLQFSISDNPLNYNSVLKLLEVLNENKALCRLALLGIQFKGAAPIKENSSGILDAQEGIILKLAYVLRGSLLSYIALDIAPVYDLHLKELENTLIKHNQSLCGIDSRLIDWNCIPADSPLVNIQLALKANKWLNSNSSGPVPADIKDIVKIKESYSMHTEESRPRSSKNSFVNFTETSEDVPSPHSSPQFAGKDKKSKRQNPGRLVSKFFEKIKELEARDQKKDQVLAEISKKLDLFNDRLCAIESKLSTQSMAENSIKNIESLKFSISPSSTKVSTIENSVKTLFTKIRNIEDKAKEPIEKTLINKFVSFEDRLNQIEKVSSNVTKKNAREAGKKQKKGDRGTAVRDSHVRKFEYSSPAQNRSAFKVGQEYESVIMGALMERVNFSLKNSPERPMSAMSLHNSYTRAPSSDLQESLRKRGLILHEKY